MSSDGRDWSWGPDTRRGPQSTSVVTAGLGAVIVVLLLAGVVGIAIHHKKASASATPPGYQRITDVSDQMTLAVPATWRVLPLTTGQLSSSLAALRASHPELSSLLDLAQASLRQIQPGTFAVDVTSRTTLLSYGVVSAQVQQVGDIPVAEVVAPFTALGAKNVRTTRIHLPIGDAEQLMVELPLGSLLVTEVLDYFVRNHRVIVVVLASRGGDTPTTLFHQIEQTLAPAP